MHSIETDYQRTTTVHPACVRVVNHGDEYGEWWCQYAILDRAALLEYFREVADRVANDCNKPRHNLAVLRLAYRLAVEPYNDAHYGGPGRAFAHKPWIYHRTRRHYVITQSGGLDI